MHGLHGNGASAGFRRRQALLFAAFFLVALSVPRVLRAGKLIDVHLLDRVPAGRKPVLTVKVFEDLEVLELELTSDGGRRFHQKLENVPRASERRFALPQQRGVHRWRGVLRVVAKGADSSGEMKLDFSCEVVSSLGLVVKRSDIDLEARRLRLRSERNLARVEFEVIDESGRRVHSAAVPVNPPSNTMELQWPAAKLPVMKIRLRAHDTAGITEDIELVPWQWKIPHEEVVFDTGSWEIKQSELPKLERSWKLLQKGLRKYGRLLDVKLYIAGFTDTVASADYNQRLSEKRARAIAKFFQSKGFRHPIYYQGFGERGLKVPTPDETDEPRNRRAEYVLAAEPPPLDVPGAELHWKRLQ